MQKVEITNKMFLKKITNWWMDRQTVIPEDEGPTQKKIIYGQTRKV